MKLTAENSKGEKMKYRLARSMKECMKTMSVDNITVNRSQRIVVLRGRLSIGILWTNLTLSTGISISFWRNPLSIWEWEKLFMMLW